MDGAKAKRGNKIPFSSPLLNYSTYGGIPRDAITEFFGAPGGGKSSTAVDICKTAHAVFQSEYQAELLRLQSKINEGNKSLIAEYEDTKERGPKKVLYIDLEHSFDAAWANTLGIQEGEIDIMQPPDVVAESISKYPQFYYSSKYHLCFCFGRQSTHLHILFWCQFQ